MKIKNTLLLLSILLLLLLSVASCKKNIDEQIPDVTINSPYENQQFSVFDTIQINAKAEDETTLEKIEVILTDANRIPIQNIISLFPQQKKVTISVPFILEDVSMSTGTYYIWIKASDGTNTSNTFRTIIINGVPRELKDIYIFTYGNSATIHVIKKTLSGNPQQQFDINGDFSGSAISSKNQLLYSAGKIYGNLHAYNVLDNSESWNVPIVSNPPFPYFTNISCYNDILYCSFYDGMIRGYNKNGTALYTAITPYSSYPIKVSAGNNYVYVDHAMYSGSARIFGVYFFVSGILKQQLNTDYNAVRIFEKDNDNVFIFANKNGQGLIKIFSISGNGTWEPHTLPSGKINDVVQIDENAYIIAHENGLFKYQYNNNSLTDYSAIVAKSLKYEELASEIYACTTHEIKILKYNSNTLVNNIMVADSIVSFELLYNK